MLAVLRAHGSGTVPEEAPALPSAAFASVVLDESVPFVRSVDTLAPQPSVRGAAAPVTMEYSGQNYGYMAYRVNTTLATDGLHVLAIEQVRDRAFLWVDGRRVDGMVYRAKRANLSFTAAAGVVELLLVVENCGRINFGSHMTDPKGILGSVWVDGVAVMGGWQVQSLPLDASQLSTVPWQLGGATRDAAASGDSARWLRGWVSLGADDVVDTVVDMSEWDLGVVWVNGFNLGRYWVSAGPQHSLYAPAPLWRAGVNEITVLEWSAVPAAHTVHFSSAMTFSPTETCASS